MLKRRSKSALYRAAFIEPLERRILLSTTITATQGQILNVADLDGTGDVFIPAGVSVTVNQIRENSLTVAGNIAIGSATAGAFDPTHASVLNSLAFATSPTGAISGQLDIGNNALIIHPSSYTQQGVQATLNAVWADVVSGYNNGLWNGQGIISSAAAQANAITPESTAVGVLVDDGGSTNPDYVTFAGQSVSPGDIIIAWTRMGDAQLAGKTTNTDAQIVSAFFNQPGEMWIEGNFEYANKVNFADMQLVSANFNGAVPVSTALQAGIFENQFAGQVSTELTGPPEDYTATIDWGDGSGAVPEAIVSEGNGTYDIFGDHIYTQATTNSPDHPAYTATSTLFDSSGTPQETIDTTTVEVQPPTVSSFTATYVSPTVTNLNWNNSATLPSTYTYTVERGIANSGWTPISSALSSTTTTFTDPGPLLPSTNYSYRIQIIEGGDASTYSSTSAFTTPDFPNAPTGLTATAVSPSQISLTWTDPNTTPSSFYLMRTSAGVSPSTIGPLSGSADSYVDSGLNEGTQYTYQLSAAETAGGDADIDSASAYTQLLAPTNLAVIVTDTGPGNSAVATLSWTNNSTLAQDIYIDDATNGGNWGTLVVLSASNGVLPSDWIDPYYVAGVSYQFRVSASNSNSGSAEGGSGIGAASSAFNNTSYTDPNASNPITPTPPIDLAATPASDTEIDLSWTNTDPADTTGFTGVESESTDYFPTGTPFTIADPSATSYSYTGLAPNSLYFFSIAATNGSSTSQPIETDTGVYTLPVGPTSIYGTQDGGEGIDLSWTMPPGLTNTAASGYQLQRSTDGINWTTVYSPTSLGALSYDAGNVSDTNNYDYRVASTGAGPNALSSYVYSNEITIVPPVGSNPDGSPNRPPPPPPPPGGGKPGSGPGGNPGGGPPGGTGGEQYILVDNVAIPSDGSIVDSIPTLPGVSYDLEAQGYVDIGYAWWNFSNTGDTLADASYADFVNPTPNDPGIVDSGFKYGVFVDGADPGWGAYNPNHVYDVNYSGTGKPIQFYYSDDDYGDNSGSMNVLVFELEMNPTPPPPNGGQNPPPNPNPPPPRLPPPPPNSPPPNNSPDEQDTIDVWDQNSPVDPAGDLLNMVTAVIPQAAPPVSLCVPETQYGDAVIDMATQATDTVDYSINGVTASPDNGTVSSAGIAVVLTPTDGTQDFLITLTDEQTDVTAEVDVFVTQPLVNPETVHDTPTGSFLSQSDKTNGSVGAYVPIDDGDFNYDGVLDDHEPGDAPPVGDDRLLPIVLKGTGSSAPGDYYSFPSIPSFIKVFQTTNTPTGVALAQVTSTTQLQSQSDQTLYVEGTAQGNDTLNVNFTTNGAAYTNVDYFWITTFEMTGPMDVPGNGTYEYTATGEVNGANTLPSSAFWVSPTGGALDTIIGPDDVTIQWNNPAAGEVGKARFLVNGSYEWDFDVNVVGVTLGTYSVNYGGPPTQESTSNSFIDSGPPGGPSHDTASIDASVTLTGPVAPGSNKMRGVKFIDIGIIQNGQVAQYNALFADQSTLTSSLQGSQTYLDSTYSGPWYNPATPIGKDSTKATLVPHLSLDDFPSGWGVTKTGILLNYNGNPTLNPGYALTNLNLLVNFTDWIAAATVETVNGSAVVPAAQGVSQNEYAGLWETKWYFNGSGSFYIISTSPTFQEGYTTSGKDDGDVTLSPATDPILTTGPILGDVVNSDQNEWR